MSPQTSNDPADLSQPVVKREEIFKYTVPISDGRKLYFYTFGSEQLELPDGSALTEITEVANV